MLVFLSVAFLIGVALILQKLSPELIRQLLGGAKDRGAPTYRKNSTLLTPAEQAFWDVLRPALPEGVQVSFKVRLFDVVRPDDGRDKDAQNRVIQKHLDFVLIECRSSRILGVIELDDASHRRADRRRSDLVKNDALASAGVRILRVPCARSYDIDFLALELTALCNVGPSRIGQPVPA